MKVLHVLGELNPSGAETMLSAAGPLWQDFGIQAEILSTGRQIGPYAEQLNSAGYVLHHIAFQKSPRFFWLVYRLMQSKIYDVIHLHTERANFWFGLIALLTGKRTLRTIHNTFPFTGLLGWTRKWQRHFLRQLGLTHIAISQSVQDTEYQYYGLSSPIIQNWYNSERFLPTDQMQREQARADLNIAADHFVILSVGNCSLVKNHAVLIDALATLKQIDWRYLHIGIEIDSSERQQVQALGIADRVHFYGLQTDILPYLQAADLFVMPSTYEGFGIAAIEAIATGLPALLTEVPGLTDFKNVFDGLHYCSPTAANIAKILQEIVKYGPERIRQQCVENPGIAVQRFGIQRGLTSYVDFYNN